MATICNNIYIHADGQINFQNHTVKRLLSQIGFKAFPLSALGKDNIQYYYT
jgi:hypothetical protein